MPRKASTDRKFELLHVAATEFAARGYPGASMRRIAARCGVKPAALYYWFPKFTGRFLSESIGSVSFWLMFVGMNTTFFPMHFLGLSGMPRRIYTYDAGLGWDRWNFVATAGSYILALGVLLFVVNVVRSLRQPRTAPDNPWDAATLEWATSSPPPAHNFTTIPEVRDRDPLWYERDHPRPVELGAVPARPIHLPPPSYFPLVITIGVVLIGIGLLSHLALSFAGIAVVVYGVWGWALEPTA